MFMYMHKAAKVRKAALATRRLIVPISPSDKRTVERKAAAGGMSMAEFVRRAALSYNPGAEQRQEEEELRALLETFDSIHTQTLAQLDRADAALDAALEHFADKRST